MGCVFGRHCDPSPPDPSVRHYWHVDAVVVEDETLAERRRGGIVYIQDEAVCYKSRRLDCRKTGGELRLDIASIKNTSRLKDYQCDKDAAKSSNKVEVVLLEMQENNKHLSVGLVTNKSEKVHKELSDIINKHRQKPKIMQFNSVDIEGVEIDLPS